MTLETKDTFNIVRGVQHKHEHAARRACLDNAGYNTLITFNVQSAHVELHSLPPYAKKRMWERYFI